MKKIIIILTLAISVLASCQNQNGKVELNTRIDSLSYIMGASDGERLYQSFKQQKFDSILNLDLYFTGLTDATTEDGKLKYDVKEKLPMVQNFFRDYQANQMEVMQDTTGTVKPIVFDRVLLDSVSYIMGANDGEGMTKGFKNAGLDTIVSFKLYLKGLFTTGKGGESLVPVKENIKMVQDFFAEVQENRLLAEFGDIKKEGEEFLAKNKAREEVTETESGLQYEVLKEGKGAKPAATDKVKVHYHGTLLDGTVFDSSVDRGEPIEFNLSGVIQGWTEGLQLMPIGSKYKFYIPYDLAYGTRPAGTIKPFQMLIFEVELLDITTEK